MRFYLRNIKLFIIFLLKKKWFYKTEFAEPGVQITFKIFFFQRDGSKQKLYRQNYQTEEVFISKYRAVVMLQITKMK